MTTTEAPRPRLPSEEQVEETLLALLAREPAATIDLSEPARLLYQSAPDWQRALPVVRRVAMRLARQGRIAFYRKGKPVDPDDLRGVYRLGRPPTS